MPSHPVRKVHFDNKPKVCTFEADVMSRYDYAKLRHKVKRKRLHPPDSSARSRNAARKARWLARRLEKQLKQAGGDFCEAVGNPCETEISLPAHAPARNRTWIVDSGSCNHLAGRTSLSQSEQATVRKAARPHKLRTANGVINVDETLPITTDATGNVEVLLLENSPAVLSLGRLCMEHGFAFEWKPGMRPTLTTASGDVTQLEVDRFVPSISAVALSGNFQ